MDKYEKSMEIIKSVENNVWFDKEEFEQIANYWLPFIREYYPGLTHAAVFKLKNLNKFCIRFGYMWKSKTIFKNRVGQQIYCLVLI
jgi:hypothetical protein